MLGGKRYEAGVRRPELYTVKEVVGGQRGGAGHPRPVEAARGVILRMCELGQGTRVTFLGWER